MGSIITVLIILVCVLLIIVVLIQNSKGGGLSSQFAGSNQIMGVRRTADFLEKAIALLVLSLLSSANISKANGTTEAAAPANSEVKQKLQESGNLPTNAPSNLVPKATTPTPAQGTKDPKKNK
jgi:preprotein translocase subunit SecG